MSAYEIVQVIFCVLNFSIALITLIVKLLKNDEKK